MDTNEIKEAAVQVRSRIKQAISKITGDAKTRAEGTAGKATSEAESIHTRAERTIRDMAKE